MESRICDFLQMRRFNIFLFTLLFTLCSSWALEIQGVTPAQQVQVSGQTLQLNGAGLRSFTLLMIPIKIYVAAFYAPVPLHSDAAVMASPGPLQFDFTFLRAVGQGDVTKAWTSQFSQSVSYSYPGYEKDRDAFISYFGPLQSMGVERVQFVGTNTLVYDSGKLKGTIAGRDFQKAFLSLWFGANPVAPDLKTALLGN
jgi:hypothetical protein